jgi:uncharacterized protein (TIGR02118 family)
MSTASAMVLYPQPTDAATFDRLYEQEHVQLAQRIPGLIKLSSKRVLGAAAGQAPYYVIAELHFPSLEALQAATVSPEGQQALGHAAAISTGGPPVVLACAEPREFAAEEQG